MSARRNWKHYNPRMSKLDEIDAAILLQALLELKGSGVIPFLSLHVSC
jgi:hypothetical protein